MKKLLLILSIGGFGIEAFSQGTVNFVNGSYALISTNAEYLTSGFAIGYNTPEPSSAALLIVAGLTLACRRHYHGKNQ